MKTKRLYKITYKGLVHTCSASSAQNACRKAFRLWISLSKIGRQPKSRDGGFMGVEVELL